MSASLGLFRLQQVDSQVDHIQARLNIIRQTLENDVELRETLNRIELTLTEKGLAEAVLREAEAQVKDQQVKIQQAESSLYGGNIHNPKELQDLQNDVGSLKRYLSALEERELEAMLQMEAAERNLDLAQSGLEDLKEKRGGEHQVLVEEQTELNKNLGRLNTERKAVVSALANQTLEKYDNLRQLRRGVAVAEINDNSCSACGTTLTAALQQNARSTTQVAYCPTCGRILYAA